MSLPAVVAEFDVEHGLIALNIARCSLGWQVSTRRRGSEDGWTVYSGYDLTETIQRAVDRGPQLAAEDDWGGLV